MPTADETLLVQKAMMLYKIAFDKSARAAGGSVRFASQHSLLWGAMNKGGHGAFDNARWLGVCAGLSMEWMKYKCQGKDFIGLFYKIRNEVMGKQEGPKLGVAGFAGMVDASHVRQNNVAGALAGMFTPVGSPQQYSAPYTKFSTAMRGGNYYYISTGSHAMAGRMVGSGGVDFYDPNVGEVTGTTPRFFDTYFRDAINATCIAKGYDAAQTKELFDSKQFTATAYRPIR
jgi:hypothetical protein